MIDARIVVDGVGIRFRAEGEGPPLILLHGFTGSAEAMADLARELSPTQRVISIDLVGHGTSDSPTDGRHYRMGAASGHVLAVADHLGLDRVHLCGYSMGARTALAVACRAPERISSLHLIGVNPGLDDPDAALARRAADDRLAQSILDEPLSMFVDRWMANPLFATQERLGAAALEAARNARLRNNPVGLAGSLRGMGTGSMPSMRSAVGSVTAAVELIVGELDGKFQDIAADLAPLFPSARQHVVPEVGHAVHLEAPEVTAEIVRSAISLAERDLLGER